MIRIPHSAYADMSAHAANVYPYECCGYITGTADTATWTVHRCRNIQNDLHARDPRQYPRDARTAYVFSQEDMTALFHGEFEPPDARVIGFYHSHPDHSAYFSEKDRLDALTDWLDPEPGYLVLSVLKGRVEDLKWFQWGPDRETFEELTVEVL